MSNSTVQTPGESSLNSKLPKLSVFVKYFVFPFDILTISLGSFFINFSDWILVVFLNLIFPIKFPVFPK